MYLRYGDKCLVNWASQHVHFAVGICWKRRQSHQEGEAEKEIETEAEKEAVVDAQAEEDWTTPSLFNLYVWMLVL